MTVLRSVWWLCVVPKDDCSSTVSLIPTHLLSPLAPTFSWCVQGVWESWFISGWRCSSELVRNVTKEAFFLLSLRPQQNWSSLSDFLGLFTVLLICDQRALLPRYRLGIRNMFSAPLISDRRHIVLPLMTGSRLQKHLSHQQQIRLYPVSPISNAAYHIWRNMVSCIRYRKCLPVDPNPAFWFDLENNNKNPPHHWFIIFYFVQHFLLPPKHKVGYYHSKINN